MNTIITEDIDLAATFLNKNAVIGFPTETVYGLAGNALEQDAVIKIFEAKNRPYFNPLIIHVKNINTISEFAHLDELSSKLAYAFMPGSLTLLLPKKQNVPDIVTAGSNKVAIRIPNHSSALALLHKIEYPLAAPSANVFGYVSPVSAKHVFDGLNGKIPLILNGGNCSVGVESTIVEVVNNTIIVHRVGGVTSEDIEEVIGHDGLIVTQKKSNQVQTAGQLKSHYATKTPLYQGNIAELWLMHNHKNVAIISFNNFYKEIEQINQFVLSPKGSLIEAAQNLFSTFRDLDNKGYDAILVEHFPNKGLGRAINDRIQRAQYINK